MVASQKGWPELPIQDDREQLTGGKGVPLVLAEMSQCWTLSVQKLSGNERSYKKNGSDWMLKGVKQA